MHFHVPPLYAVTNLVVVGRLTLHVSERKQQKQKKLNCMTFCCNNSSVTFHH